jgi:hypothetical protein
MKLLNVSFSPFLYYLVPLGPDIFPNTLLSNTLNLCSSLNEGDQV